MKTTGEMVHSDIYKAGTMDGMHKNGIILGLGSSNKACKLIQKGQLPEVSARSKDNSEVHNKKLEYKGSKQNTTRTYQACKYI